jgi:hypothetical protein
MRNLSSFLNFFNFFLVMALMLNVPLMLIVLAARRRLRARTARLMLAIGLAAAAGYLFWRIEYVDVWRHGVPSIRYMATAYLPVMLVFAGIGWLMGILIGPRSRAAILAIAAVSLFLAPQDAQAQCAGVSCANLPKPNLQFSFVVPEPKQEVKPRTAPPQPVAPPAPVENAPIPIDCKMVKPPDPKFHSSMPVVRPDPNVEFTMKIVIVPPCKS